MHHLLLDPIRLPDGSAARWLHVPPGVLGLVRTIVAASGLTRSIRFVWADHMGGYIGLYSGGVVAIGERDIRDLAARVQRDTGLPFNVAWWGAVRYIIAHEIGHALQDELGLTMTGVDAECDADATSARIGRRLGWDMLLHETIGYTIGCIGPYCTTHPSPTGRAYCVRCGDYAEACAEWMIRNRYGNPVTFG